MAWCMNPNCGKKGLKKEDVEFDEDLGMVLCTGCYCLRHPAWVPPAQVEVLNMKPPFSDGGFKYDMRLNSDEGFTAKATYAGLNFAFHMPADEINKLLGTGKA